MINSKAGFVCKKLEIIIRSFFADTRWTSAETKDLNFVYHGKTNRHLI